jgi:hypothetical protein
VVSILNFMSVEQALNSHLAPLFPLRRGPGLLGRGCAVLQACTEIACTEITAFALPRPNAAGVVLCTLRPRAWQIYT